MGRGLCTVMVVLLSAEIIVGGLLKHCPRTYSITRTYSGKETVIDVKDQQHKCYKLLNKDKFELVSNDDLLPEVRVIRKDGDYFLNFSWKASVVDGKFPRTFLVLVEYSIPKENVGRQSECIALKLKGRRKADENESSSYFSFQCIRLSNDPVSQAGNLSIQILNYSLKEYNGRCSRQRRAVGQLNTCRAVECSDERHHSLSLDVYKTEICSCYESEHGVPSVDVDYIPGPSTIDFSVTVSNLPDFLETVEVGVYRDGLLVPEWSETFDGHVQADVFKNGSVFFLTNGLPFRTGNYSLKIVRNCMDSRTPVNTLKSTCTKSDSYTAHLKEVTVQAEPIEGKHVIVSVPAMISVFLIVVMLAVGVTIAVFIWGRGKRQDSSADTNRDISRRSQPRNNEVSQETRSYEESIELLEPRKKVLLHHPNDVCPTLQRVRSKLQVELLDGRYENWQNFASNAVTRYHDVVIFLSEGLVELLCGDKAKREARFAERFRENVPCCVLQNLKSLIQCDRDRNDFFVHIVSTKCDRGKELTSIFLQEHPYLTNTKNFCVYQISPDFGAHPEGDGEFMKLKGRLEQFVVSHVDTE